uniref:GPI ethanolamine phosphate transferase 1 n=3 Tax=Meloidogyne TaxID=189290 RepID=A0A915NXF6_9BILA
APLQSALLGIAIPSNSFGIVPINLLGHLPDKYIFQSVYANFKQMSEQFLIRRAERRAHSFRFLFCEYPELSYEGLVKIENEIIRLAQLKRYEAAWKACIKLIPIIRSALNYFHRYNQFSQVKYSKHHNESNSIRERQFRREQVFEEEEEIFPTKFNSGNSVGDFNNNKWYWLILCILLSIFPLLDTVGNSQRPLLVILAEFIYSSSSNKNIFESNQGNNKNINLSEFMKAVFLVICIEMAFFGTGNISSLNSFNPSFLHHFISIFSPFIMAALLLLKIFIPFLLVSLYFVSSSFKFNQNNNEVIKRLSTIVALITNTMAMVFFYCLKTDGSWLQIGISISNYVICLVCSAATYLLLHLANWLLF